MILHLLLMLLATGSCVLTAAEKRALEFRDIIELSERRSRGFRRTGHK